MWRLPAIGIVVLSVLGGPAPSGAQGPAPGGVEGRGPAASAPRVQLRDLGNHFVDPFQVPSGTKATVLLFTSTQCPISNRYAPEMRRLHDAFARQGVVFWLIYADPSDSVEDIRAHVSAFAQSGRALRDPEHVLVRLAGATVTPEAAVFDRHGRIVYRGRIDDRYLSLGVDRPMPTVRDLEEALTAVVAGKPVRTAVTRAVGCFLADFRS